MKKYTLLFVHYIIILLFLTNQMFSQTIDGQELPQESSASKEDLFKYYIDLGESNWRTDKRKTDSLARLGLSIARDTVINDSLLAEGYHLLGKTLIDMGDHQTGIDTLLKCIIIKERAYGENRLRSSRTYNYIGLGYLYSFDFENAKLYFTKAISVIRVNEVFVPELFDTYMNLGILNKSIGEYSKAYYHLGRAKMVLDSLGTRADSVLIAQFHSAYGNLATTNGKFKEAGDYYSIAESIFLSKFGPNYDWLGSIYISRGEIEFLNENYNQALLYFQQALEIYLYHNMTKIGIPMSYHYLGETSLKLKNYKKAISFCEKGLGYAPTPNTRISLLKNLASSYSKLGNTKQANNYFLQALEYADNKNVHPIKRIKVYREYADFLFENRQYKKSKYYYDAAMKKVVEDFGEGSDQYGTLLSNLGDYYLEYTGDLFMALEYFEKACAYWNKFFNVEENKFSSLFPNEIDFVSAYRGKARTLFKLYTSTGKREYLEESLRFYQIVLNRAELVNKNMDKENNYLLLERLKPVYEEAISAGFVKDSLDKDSNSFRMVFELAEMSKASVLLNSIQNNYALKTAEVPTGIVDFEHRLKNEINGLKKLRTEEDRQSKGSSKKISFYNSQLLELMIRHDSLKESIEERFPRYYQLKFDRTLIHLDTLMARLESNQAIIEYVLTDSALFLFLVTNDTFDLRRINIHDKFHTALNSLIEIKNTDISMIGEGVIIDYIEQAGYLWECLIEPVFSQITGKHLIIIPDGLLGYLPFEILLSPNEVSEVEYFNQLPYLIKEFPISYAHSSTLKYNSFFRGKQEATAGLVSFSPSYNADKKNTDRGHVLSNLPYSDEEAKTVKKIFGGKAYRNSKATKTRFVQESGDYQLIHLAMHALINDSLPMLSELVFAPSEKNTSSNVLHTYEVFGLDLTADLVTLSACNTGSGKLQQGEGIMSLARGFIYAGVPAVVMTLWEVQDKSGYEIMSSFYTYLKAGEPKDIAMQKAKLDFLGHSNMLKSHPYFWSSYIVSGDSSTIEIIEQERDWTHLFIGAGLVLIIFAFILYKVKSARTV